MSALMNLGAGLQGLVGGVERGTKYKNEQEQAQFEREQRDRTRKDWQKADTLEAQMSDAANAYGAGDEGPVKMPRTLENTLAAQAQVQASHGLAKDAAATAGLARQEKSGKRADKLTEQRDKIFKDAMTPDRAYADYGRWMATLGQPDGHIAFAKEVGPLFNSDQVGGPEHAGGRVYFDANHQNATYIDPQGNVAGTSPWNAEIARQQAAMLLQHRLAMLSPEDYQQQQELGLKQRQVGATELGARATMKNADTQERYRTDQAPVLAAQARMMGAQAGYYDRMPRDPSAGGGAGAVNGELVKLAQQYASLSPEQQHGAEGQSIIRQVGIIKAKIDPLTVFGDNKPGKAPLVLNDAQKIAYPKFLDAVQANTKATPNQIAALAQRFGLPPEVTGVQPVDYAGALANYSPTGGKAGTKTTPGPTAGTPPNTGTVNDLRSLVQSGVGLTPPPTAPDWANMQPTAPRYGQPGWTPPR
jgi:hypothetical protein